MSAQLPLHFPTVTAPRFEDSPTAYAVWLLDSNPELYKQYRRRVEERLARDPSARIGSKQVIEIMRWFSDAHAEGDVAKINNNCTSLFARLYVLEHPEHEGAFTTRRSVWDSLDKADNERLLLAFEKVRKKAWPKA